MRYYWYKLQTWSFNGYVYVIMFAYFPHCAALVCLGSETIADNLMRMLCVWSQCLEMSSRKENDFRDTFGSRLRADHVRKSDLCAVLRQEIQRCWSETTKLWHFYIWVHGKLTAWLNAVHAQPSPTVISGQRSRKGSKISDSFKIENPNEPDLTSNRLWTSYSRNLYLAWAASVLTWR